MSTILSVPNYFLCLAVSGWNNGFAFIIGFLTPLWVVGVFDSIVHVSEEATNAKVALPFAIILSAISGVVLGWGKSCSILHGGMSQLIYSTQA